MIHFLLLAAAIACLLSSLKFFGPTSWVLGVLGIVLLISSYLWEVYRKT